MDTDLRDELDRAFGEGPSHRPLDARLAAGRRALLRRRIATGAASAAVVAVIGTSYAVASGTHERAIQLPPAVTTVPPPPVTADEPPAEPSSGSEQPRWGREFVRYSADLELEVRPGATLLTRIRNPAGVAPPAVSDAVTVRWRGTDYWAVLDGDASTSGTASIPAAPGGTWADLRSWADTMIANDRAVQPDRTDDPAAGFPGTVVRFDDGRLVADEGFRIIEQQPVDLGENFAPAGATTALALVGGGGQRRWWLGRIIDGLPDYLPYPAPAGQTTEEFVAFARDRYASGEGLR